MKIILPGGSGFLGRSFERYASALGHECYVLTRRTKQSNDIEWDGKSQGAWSQIIDGAEAVVNFTGRSVNCIYNEANQKEIIESRVDSVNAIDCAIEQRANPPRVIVQAGSLAIFGDTTESCDEDSCHGQGFSVRVCEIWEEAFFSKNFSGTRKCLLRIGFVLGPNGGALEPLRKLALAFLGGTVGKGTQYISWLHAEDLNRMIMACIEDQALNGIFNATGPNPVTNKEFMKLLRETLGRPWSPPAPESMVRIGALLIMRADPSLALTGRKCYPKRFLERGFSFAHTDLEETLKDVLGKWS